MTKNLGFGCMRLPLLDDKDQTSIDIVQAKAMVDLFLQRGFTYFDTAYMYHDYQSERAVKEILVDRYPRDAYTITTKLPVMQLKKEEDQERIFQEQLAKLGVDYVDYYLLHNLGEEHYKIAQRFDSFAFIKRKQKEGKIRHIGFSYHDHAELLDEILTQHPEVEVVQIQLNYLDYDNLSIQSRKCLEVIQKHQKHVIVMEPVKGGALANVPDEASTLFKHVRPNASIPSWAIRFAASQEGVRMVLSGMSTMAQLEDNTSYMQDFIPMNAQEYEVIQKAVQIIQKAYEIPCTACRYCIEGCPKNIAIPNYFALYNRERSNKSLGAFSVQQMYYEKESKVYGKASDCIACHACERSCPQHIPIVQELQKVANIFE